MNFIVNILIGIILLSVLITVGFVASLLYAIQEIVQWRKKRLESMRVEVH